MCGEMRVAISLIRFALGFVFMAVASVVTLAVLIILLPFRVARIKVANVYGKTVGRVVVAVAGVTMDVENRAWLRSDMPAVFVMNHASSLDAFIATSLAPYGTCGIFKREIVRIPFFGQAAWLSGHVLLDRSNHLGSVRSLDAAAALFRKKGLGVLFFPEGTRSRDGRLQPFKRGFVHVAIATGFPVVPIVVHGAHRNWRKGDFLNFTSMRLRIEILRPIDTKDWSNATSALHAQELHDVFVRHLPEDQQPLTRDNPSA